MAPPAPAPPTEEEVEIEETPKPASYTLRSILQSRHWSFSEVLYIRGASTHLSRSELISSVASAKGVTEDRVDCCFFDESDLSHAVAGGDKLGAAGEARGDVVCVWRTDYKPADHKRYSRKWVKTKAKMDAMPARHYLVTAIRKNGLLDDEREQHLSASLAPAKAEDGAKKKKKKEEDEDVWLPPAFASDGKDGPVNKKAEARPKLKNFS